MVLFGLLSIFSAGWRGGGYGGRLGGSALFAVLDTEFFFSFDFFL